MLFALILYLAKGDFPRAELKETSKVVAAFDISEPVQDFCSIVNKASQCCNSCKYLFLYAL